MENEGKFVSDLPLEVVIQFVTFFISPRGAQGAEIDPRRGAFDATATSLEQPEAREHYKKQGFHEPECKPCCSFLGAFDHRKTNGKRGEIGIRPPP